MCSQHAPCWMVSKTYFASISGEFFIRASQLVVFFFFFLNLLLLLFILTLRHGGSMKC